MIYTQYATHTPISEQKNQVAARQPAISISFVFLGIYTATLGCSAAPILGWRVTHKPGAEGTAKKSHFINQVSVGIAVLGR